MDDGLTARGGAAAASAAVDVSTLTVEAGLPWPMGVHPDGDGLNIAVFSANAQAIDFCVFDAEGAVETARLRLPAHTNDVWHGYVRGARAGMVYGLRAHGPWRPDKGLRFNPNKLLLDPYAREIIGHFAWTDEQFAADRQFPRQMDTRDNAATACKARVVEDDAFDWGDDRPLSTAIADTVIYELHVKGYSALKSDVPPELRGSYAGLAHPASIHHLKRLGVTALCLLPVQHHVDEERLAKLGLVNYWGYNTIGFFSPEPTLGSAAARSSGLALRNEFRAMVKALHAAGIEVLLDVVYNHTAENDSTGPCIAFQGLDNASYYRLDPLQKLVHENHTGCGNTVDLRQLRVLQMVLDSLRYWVEEMHVDGFRFDLATVLARGQDGSFDRGAAFFTAAAQDPTLARVKLIAEPWDIGPGGYQVGGFPRGWPEWNDRFRDDMRAFWLGHPSSRGAFAQRLCASSDIYQARARAPAESINYVVSHDGFTLRDLVSYDDKHNQANGEDNRDGTGNNLSNNCGVEGPSDDPAVNARRARLQRALLATTLLAQGTPMIAAGDELGHTQGGNNNPYCLDSPVTWIDWQAADDDLIAFTAQVIALRRSARPFANRWYSGLTNALGRHDLAWIDRQGEPLQVDAWSDPQDRVLGCLIGEPGLSPSPLLLLINAGQEAARFELPVGGWRVLLDTHTPKSGDAAETAMADSAPLERESLLLLASSAPTGSSL